MMKKACFTAACLCLFVSLAGAAMRTRDYAMDVVTTGTNSVSYTLRGVLEGVYVNAPSSKTGTVTVTSSQGTLLTVTDADTDAMYYPRAAMHTTAGAAATWNSYSAGTPVTNSVITYQPAQTTVTNSVLTYSATNMAAGVMAATTNQPLTYSTAWTPVTNSVVTSSGSGTAAAQTVYGKQALAGSITVQVVGAAGTTATNSWTVTIVYNP
jgi:hypothetical protein